MQRILSLEASRSSNLTSEFVTKRLCCSFILTVAFFAVIGGFFLGRFATDKTLQKLKTEISEISKKLAMLDKNLKNTIHEGAKSANCSVLSTISCQYFHQKQDGSVTEDGTSTDRSIHDLLDILNDCFNYG